MGTARLLRLGIRLLIKPRQQPDVIAEPSSLQQGYLACFCRGLLGNLLNPKANVFYVSLPPQFSPAGASVAFW